MIKRNTHLMLERISHIHQKIQSNSYPNQVSLSKDLETSVPTISRDIEFMRDRLLAPIEFDRTKKGYYYTQKFSINDLDISEEKIQVLLTIKTLLSYFNMTPIYNDAKNILELLTKSALKIPNVDITRRIALPPRTKVNLNNKYWYTIVEAMEKNLVVKFDYQGLTDNSIFQRQVQPYQILIDDGACYLYGYSIERQDVRVFAFSRMLNLQITNVSFCLPDNFDYQNRCGGGHFGLFTTDKKLQITVEFYDHIRKVIKERIWAEDQIITENPDKKSLTITFSSTQETKVLSWVLSYGSFAKPLSPPEFVSKWQDEVNKMKSFF